jgi:response regulator RpfG family c-di-GMP phosphodiesterase
MAILPANQPSQKSNPKEGLDLDQLHQKERPRILVVDDEPDTVILLKHVLMFPVQSAGKKPLARSLKSNHPSSSWIL